jgi:hypothetical protein
MYCSKEWHRGAEEVALTESNHRQEVRAMLYTDFVDGVAYKPYLVTTVNLDISDVFLRFVSSLSPFEVQS